MKDYVAIVTGASRGIGAAIAEKLVLNRWLVVGFDTSWQDSILPGVIGRHVVDVADYEMSSRAMAICHKMEPEDFEAGLRVNLTGAFHICHATLGTMRQRMFGRIVDISSMNAVRGQVGQTNYAPAKAGLIAMNKSIALENASRNITANCIAPDFVRSQMTSAMRADVLHAATARIPIGRIGSPEDAASTVAFLASKEASFITGRVLSVNGGQLMS